MRRYDCLLALKERIGDDDLVVTNMGGVAAEWEAVRPSDRNFPMWHSLGLCSSIGLGLALGLPHRRVWALDGDGGLLMNLGSVATIARMAPRNYRLIVFDNAAYESPGGYPTATSAEADLAAIARGAGIRRVWQAGDITSFIRAVDEALAGAGPAFIHARVEVGVADVPVPREDALEAKYRFVRMVERTEGRQIIGTPAHVSRLLPSQGGRAT
ncbi:MAG TPA: thiamine pyrophosphate-dependent enzyme [Bacillota bacterium]